MICSVSALSSLSDVKRVLRVAASDTSRDARLLSALAAVEDVIKHRLDLPLSGSNVETYWDTPEDATLHLPAADVTVTRVDVFEYSGSSGLPLSPVELGHGEGYDVTDDGRLYLRPVLGVEPFEGAVGSRPLKVYARIDVHYEGTGVVPRGVTEGVALLAAGYDNDSERLLSSLKSEKIGDYSYEYLDPVGDSSNRADTVSAYVAKALWFMGPYLRKQRVMVI